MHRILYFFIALALVSVNIYTEENKQPKTVLVVGGAGFIGSHVNKDLIDAGYRSIVLDNLYRGTADAAYKATFIEGDYADAKLLDKIFENNSIDAVLHFAALKDLGESMREPMRYYSVNVASTLVLLDAMLRHDVKVFIFSSSAAIFGVPQSEYVAEDHPCNPISPYGHSKLMMETILNDLEHAHGLRYSCLRYFNVAGGDPDGIIKNRQTKENNIIPIALRSLQRSDGTITVFGTDHPTPDGTCVRDYVHVKDVGVAHVTVLEKLFNGESALKYNLGNGLGYSVREVINAVEKVTGRKLDVIESGRREGDPAILISASGKAERELGWKREFSDLETMVEHAWQAMQ